MRLLKLFSARLRALLGREAVIRDIDEEMRLHVELETEANVRRGMRPGEARRAALRSFGNFDSLRDTAYEVRGGGMMETLLQDVRFGARVLSRHKGFTAVAVLTLALGIGANTAIFSLVNAVLLRPLKYRDPDRLVMVWEDMTAIGFPRDTPAPANFADWKGQNQSFEDMAALAMRSYDLTGDGEPERLSAYGVTANFFPLLGVGPQLGRTFLPEEDAPGADKVAVISQGLWRRRFGGDPQIVGRDILLNGEKHAVVGVMPQGFQFALAGVEVWTPLALTPELAAERGNHYLQVVARLKPGVTAERADADIKAITARIVAAYPDDARALSSVVVPLHEQLAGDVRRPLTLLLVAVGFVLLIACANVGGVLLTRAAARGREIAVRSALGASRGRIVRQLLTESVLLGAAGGLLGSLLAVWAFAFLRRLIPAGLREMTELSLDAGVFAFTLALSLLAGVAFGLAPALQASKTDLNDALKQGGRSGPGAGQRRLRNSLVVAQVALSLVLLVGAGLLIRTLYRLRGQYSDLRPESVLTVRTQLAMNRYGEHARRVAFYEGVLSRVKSLPGVEAAAYTTAVPLVWKGGGSGLTVEGRELGPGEVVNANHRQVTPDYFRALGVALKQGRPFSEQDDEGALPVAVVNEAMARAYWPGQSPLGKRFRLGEELPWLTVVGVAADVRQMGADAPVKAEMYLAYRQAAPHHFFAPRDLVVRAKAAPSDLVPGVRRAVHEVDPQQPLSSVRTLDEVLGRETAQRHTGMMLLTAFAALALLLAALGIYGVLSYFVVQHTREIGVRMALGARAGDVLRLVVGKGMALTLAGVGLGLVGALGLTRLMRSLLFEVKATDPLTFAALALLLTLVALVACLVPARRAMKIDPMEALRHE
ncbi:MAG TPA: ABC transporter permease [Pyrinomonadaceae bacterium]|nr:ABC transporter permease [Pyrinomonadaceae bacterium]